ncbi:hypothetical protein EDB80DRAFT_413877 [Ilyonectria destructans]|nr:hypothetical protein EDB80DRAFT_413877 [Ilyonectria destructans]
MSGIQDPNDIVFTNELVRSGSAEQAVMDFSKTGLGGRPSNHAVVKCTPRKDGRRSWHTGGSGKNEPKHVTVEFKQDGNHVTTKHVYYPN